MTRGYQLTRMPALPPMLSSPKVTSSLANTEVFALRLKKFTPADTSPHTSWRSSLRIKVPVVGADTHGGGAAAIVPTPHQSPVGEPGG